MKRRQGTHEAPAPRGMILLNFEWVPLRTGRTHLTFLGVEPTGGGQITEVCRTTIRDQRFHVCN